MYIQTEKTPNPNSLKFIPGKIVSSSGSFEVTKKDQVNNNLIRNLLSISGIEGIFLSKDFISINKNDETSWEDIKHIAISLINEHYISGNEVIIDKSINETSIDENLPEIEKQIIDLLNTKVKPAVEKDGGDIKFKEFKNGVVKVELKGSCSGCPSSTMTLKNGVQNLLSHYIPEVKSVEAI
jgi:Fe-S cluster biogenesis protein NfuA